MDVRVYRFNYGGRIAHARTEGWNCVSLCLVDEDTQTLHHMDAVTAREMAKALTEAANHSEEAAPAPAATA